MVTRIHLLYHDYRKLKIVIRVLPVIVSDLEARYKECEKTFMSKDVDSYVTFLSPNVEMWGPHGQPVVGKEG